MTATFYVGDAIQVMGKLPEKSVDLVLTSPPFLALRSYLPADHPDKTLEGGSQSTPGEYIDWLLDVVEACNRILAPHGSLIFELGDTYSGSGGAGGDYSEDGLRARQEKFLGSGRMASGAKDSPQDSDGGYQSDQRVQYDGHRAGIRNMNNKIQPGGPAWPLAKSLSLIPESFRWAMVYGHNPFTGRTCDTWRLRNVIRWVRPNPPVGALGDKFRPATSELMVFCKAKDRYFDLDAVREPTKPHGGDKGRVKPKGAGTGPGRTQADADRWARNLAVRTEHPAGAPPLDWWNIPPGGYPGSHYAVWPPELLIKPVKAMSPEKVCRQCGEPSRRITKDRTAFDRQPELAAHIRAQREAMRITHDEVNGWFGFKEIAKNWERTDKWGAAIPSAEVWPVLKEKLNLSGEEFDDLVLGDRHWTDDPAEYIGGITKPRRTGDFMGSGSAGKVDGGITRISATLGFSDCGHDDWRPGHVLDPFGGSGTTALVATGHGRDCVLIDLDERNYELALDRVGPFILTRGEVAA